MIIIIDNIRFAFHDLIILILLTYILFILSVKNGTSFFILAIFIFLIGDLLKTCSGFEVFNQLGSAHNLTIIFVLLSITCILRL